MLIVSLPASLGLGEELSLLLNVKSLNVVSKTFPDGESYIRLPSSGAVRGEDILLVQTTYPLQDKRLVELLLAIDAVKEYGAKEITAFIPYLAYSRQDKVFLEGEAVSIRAVMRALKCLGLGRLITLDAHSESALSFFDGEVLNVDPSPIFADVLRGRVSKPLIIAPDAGARKRAASLSKELGGVDFIVIKKFRDRYSGKISHEFLTDIDLAGKDVVVVDDIISTGGTIASIASYSKAKGALKVIAVASHGLFVGNAYDRLRRSGVDEIYVLRTVPPLSKATYVSPAKLVAEHIQKLLT
ncbi:MAG: ribose-phosphate pyrophosphokinase [Desulfurococcales archaeon ex4484_204]|nr:MAG: ribose-phosphate pyrophosphokinase [Desulfurococcales archaeon ex4484_204]